MRSLRSSQNQCCCCVVAVLLSLGSVIMTSIGVCVILKYVMINMDILLPKLQNHDGQKIVGIILTSVGVSGIVIGTLVAILYFTVCHESRTDQPAVAQKIYKNGFTGDVKSSATPQTQTNGHIQSHSHIHPKTPTKTQPSKAKSQNAAERLDPTKTISTIGVPLTSTPRRLRGKNGRPLSSNLDIVQENDSDCQLPVLQINGIGVSLADNSDDVDDVFLNGNNDFLMRPTRKSTSSAATTNNTPTIITPTTNNNTPTTTTPNNTASTSVLSTRHTPNSSSTDKTSITITSVHSEKHHTTTNTDTNTSTTEPHHSNSCDSTDQVLQTQDTDCEINSSRL